jgi:hypothetical protein
VALSNLFMTRQAVCLENIGDSPRLSMRVEKRTKPLQSRPQRLAKAAVHLIAAVCA